MRFIVMRKQGISHLNFRRPDAFRLERLPETANAPQEACSGARRSYAVFRGVARCWRDQCGDGVRGPSLWRWQERFMSEGVEGVLLRDKTRLAHRSAQAEGPPTVWWALNLMTDARAKTTHWTADMKWLLRTRSAPVAVRPHLEDAGCNRTASRQFKLSNDPNLSG